MAPTLLLQLTLKIVALLCLREQKIPLVYCMDLDFGTFTYPTLEVIFFMTIRSARLNVAC